MPLSTFRGSGKIIRLIICHPSQDYHDYQAFINVCGGSVSSDVIGVQFFDQRFSSALGITSLLPASPSPPVAVSFFCASALTNGNLLCQLKFQASVDTGDET